MTSGNAPAAPRSLAVIRNYHDLRRAIRDRCTQLRMTRTELDAEAGLADGHSSKLLSDRGIKHFGDVSLGRILEATGMLLIAAEMPGFQRADAHGDAYDKHGSHFAHWRKVKGSAWGRRMAARRAQKLSRERRREIARKAAEARWTPAT